MILKDVLMVCKNRKYI